MQGVIVKGVSGFYYVEAEDGHIYECKARGVFKKRGITPLAGDKVNITVLHTGEGRVEEIFSRLNSFDRPPVANVQTMILVCAAKEPEPNFGVLDRFCVRAQAAHAEVIICVNKTDLASDSDVREFEERYNGVYPIAYVCAKTGKGLRNLKRYIAGRQAALAGPSGVGKSTITNLLIGQNLSETGQISERLMRGKNTTRHSQLYKGDDFYIFDTPGFTSFAIEDIPENELAWHFPELRPYIGRCRFNDCRHLAEPGCAVTQAVSSGSISTYRYNSYREILLSIRNSKKY